MSLYNMLFGVNDMAQVLLKCLNFNASDIPRFRDCYLEKDRIVIHTRTGGGNRDCYDSLESCKENYPEYFDGTDDPKGPWNSDLQKHPLYLSDEDDDFDSTYANFYFKFPEEFKSDLEAISEKREDLKPSDKWTILLEGMKGNSKSE